MKKLDKLVISSFIGPFILTFLVVVFILLTQHMLKYFDDIIGKGLGWDVIGQLLFYFGIFMTPIAMPLAVLLSSLITFGNLGEHFELTAIKSAGISLTRALYPIFIFVLILTAFAFYVNNNLVPRAALEAYSLMYDIKQKKPALDLREGTFYDGIPDISMKVNKKFPDGETLKGIIIYDHRKRNGNKDVTVADSGRMYTFYNERYLKFELFNGYSFSESSSEQEMTGGKRKSKNTETVSRTKFSKSQVVFDLSSFQLSRTDKKWFQGNRIMRNLSELDRDMDSLDFEINQQRLSGFVSFNSAFSYYRKGDSLKLPEDLQRHKREAARRATLTLNQIDSLDNGLSQKINDSVVQQPNPAVTIKSADTIQKLPRKNLNRPGKSVSQKPAVSEPILVNAQMSDSAYHAKLDSVFKLIPDRSMYSLAANKARSAKTQITSADTTIDNYTTDRRVYQIQWHKILASSMACIAMFLIGAPLGAIIKRGGLGIPFLISILFFIIYYLFTMLGEKWAKQGAIPVQAGVWAADAILLIIGLVFLRQARIDARLFEADFYSVLMDKLRARFTRKT